MRRLTWKVACPRRTDGSGSVKKTGAKCANRASLRNVKRSLQSVPAWRCNESRCRVPLAISGETVNGFCADVACASSAFFGLPMRSSERNTAWAWCPIVGRRVTSSGGDRWITALMGMVKRIVQYGFYLVIENPFSWFKSTSRLLSLWNVCFAVSISESRRSFDFRQTMEVVGDDELELFQSRNREFFCFSSFRSIVTQ